MAFTIRSSRRAHVQCPVSYNAGPQQGRGAVWNLSVAGCCLTGGVLMRPGGRRSLTVTLPNEQRIKVAEAVVRWSRGREFAIENMVIERHIRARLQHYVKGLAQDCATVIR